MRYLIIADPIPIGLPGDTYLITSQDNAARLIAKMGKFSIEAAIIQGTSDYLGIVSQLRDNCPLLLLWLWVDHLPPAGEVLAAYRAGVDDLVIGDEGAMLAQLDRIRAHEFGPYDTAGMRLELGDLRQQTRFIAEDSDMAMWTWSQDGDEVWVGPQYREMLGLTGAPAPVTSAEWLTLIHLDDRDHMERAINACRMGEQDTIDLTFKALHRDKQVRWMHLKGRRFEAVAGQPVRLAGFIMNITELRQAHERFERLAENAPDMIFRWTYRNGFEYVSPSSVDVIGYTPAEHYDDPGLGYRSIHLDDLPIYESVFSDLADPDGARRYCVIRWHHKDGHLVHVEMRMAPLFDVHGNLIAIEGIARDISQHVIARERLRELTARLTEAHESERRRIAAELHDEVGQMLTVAKMHLHMFEQSLSDVDESLLTRFSTVKGMMTDALELVRSISHGLRPPLLDEMGWEPAISWLCESIDHRAGMRVSYTHQGANTRLDPAIELVAYRVVQEALTNANRHAEATQIDVLAEQLADRLCIEVRDNGKGFDMDQLQQSQAPHTGLGLLSLIERVETVRGRVHIETAPGQGVRVAVELPIESQDREVDHNVTHTTR